MATSLVVNGVSYLYPDTGDQSWGTVASAWAAAVTTGMLQKAGGTFALTADVNFGSNFGLLSKYFTSVTANPSSTGFVRLASTDAISFRNNANSADISLAKNTSDQLTWAGTAFLSSAGALLAAAMPALTGDVTSSAGSVATTVAKIGGTTVTGVTGTGNVVFSASPTFTGTIGAAALTLSTALGIASGGTGQTTQTAAFDALSPNTTKGDITVRGVSNNVRLPVGSDGQVLTADSAQTSGLSWTSPLTNPMTTAGDLIVGGTAGAATRFAKGSNGNVLTMVAGAIAWAAPATAGTVTSVTFTGDGTVLSSTPSSAVTSSGTVTASLATQTARTFLSGPLSGSAAAPTFKALAAPTIQKFTSTGTTTGWLFTISTSSTVAVGDTYTNNGNTYTVLGALTAQTGQVLFTSGASAPLSSGTLTRATGAGTASITFTASTALATYTPPTNPAPLWIEIEMVGGGGAGGGGSTSGSGGSGTSSLFGANILSASGGLGGGNFNGGTSGGAAAGGGGATVNSPAISRIAMTGSTSAAGFTNSATTTTPSGSQGAAGPWGGAGNGGAALTAGGSAAANSGSGGGGQGATSGTGSAAGGGAGGYLKAVISNPATTYPYCIGSGGTPVGTAGGSGGSGVIVVTEHYQ